MKKLLASIVTCLVKVMLIHNVAVADTRMPRIFGDHMVLQRNAEVRVWGWDRPGKEVTVRMAGQQHTVRAGDEGTWEVTLLPMDAGGPYEMHIKGSGSVSFKDILVGEVWVCSGQSNMEWSVRQSADAGNEIQAAVFPEIRLFTVPRRIAIDPKDDLEEGQWLLCSPETVSSFSAVAYYFGRHLHVEKDVPVGLIHSSWGGTVAETWISRESMEEMEDFHEVLAESGSFDPERMQEETDRIINDWYRQADEKDAGLSNKWYDPFFDDSGWNEMELPCLWEHAGYPGLDGVVWFRKEIMLQPEQATRDLVLNIGPVDDSDYTYVNGQLVGSMIEQYNTNRRYVVSAEHLVEGKNIIAVRVLDTGGGGGIWGERANLYYQSGDQTYSLSNTWRYAVGAEMASLALRGVRFGPNMFPSLLYNGMIVPITGFSVRGAIWYQGESNAGRAYQYRTLFPLLIRDWRKQWDNDDMPFLFVQLANYMAALDNPAESEWAELREAQTMALALPYTGMAVAIDIGEADDIHPGNKQDVGLRLALAARNVAYGEEIVSSGPLYSHMKSSGDSIRIVFDHTGGGLVAKDRYGYLKGFSVAGEDRVFHWARAYIDGNEVVVCSDRVSNPVAVRYAWANNPEDANLYNREGLPASPFRTDDWPGITAGRK